MELFDLQLAGDACEFVGDLEESKRRFSVPVFLF